MRTKGIWNEGIKEKKDNKIKNAIILKNLFNYLFVIYNMMLKI